MATFLVLGTAKADNYYVNASTGNNASGNGSQANPGKTITYALDPTTGSGHALYAAASTYGPAIGETFPIFMRDGVSLVGWE